MLTPAKPRLIVRDSSGSTKATLDCDSGRRTTEYRKMKRGQAVVDAGDWNDLSLDSRNDTLIIERPDGSELIGGRYDDDQREGDATVVKVVSFRRDAIDAKPTDSNLILQNTSDSTVIQTYLIDAVPALSAGTVQTLANAVTWSFPNTDRAQIGTKVAQTTGGELRYNADGSVDYVDRLGSDKSVTISPENRNVVGEPRVTQDVRDEITHIQGYGAQGGPEQITAEAVASGYSGGKQVWGNYKDPDIKEQSRLQTVIDRLVDDLDGEPRKLTVEATLIDVDVQLGDRLPVVLPDRGIDRMLRITKLVERFGEKGRDFVATLTNRQADDDLNTDPREVRDRVGRGYQGLLDRDTQTSGWNPAGDGTPQSLVIPNWPDNIQREDRVDLVVQGRAWRAPLNIESHSHSFSVTHPSHAHTNSTTSDSNNSPVNSSINNKNSGSTTMSVGSSTTLDTFSPSADAFLIWVHVDVEVAESGNAEFFCEIADGGGVQDDHLCGTEGQFDHGSATLLDASVGSNETYDIQVRPIALSADPSNINWRIAWSAMGLHDHDVSSTSSTELGTTNSETSDAATAGQAEVVTSFSGNTYYPTDVEITAGGTTVTTISGDPNQEWQETVDLTGVLSSGQQEITAEPVGQRGEVNLTLQSELYRTGPT